MRTHGWLVTVEPATDSLVAQEHNWRQITDLALLPEFRFECTNCERQVNISGHRIAMAGWDPFELLRREGPCRR